MLTTVADPPRPMGTPPKRGLTSGDEDKRDLFRSSNATKTEKIPSGGVARSDGVGLKRVMTHPFPLYRSDA